MGEIIRFQRPDGQEAPGYLATAANRGPAVVVVQEWWGLNPQIMRMADRFAEAGFTSLVPDLYRGEVARDADEASHLMQGLDWIDAATQDIRGALAFLKKRTPKAGVLGFCMGGALTLLAAAKVEEVDAGVCFYGIPPKEAADPRTIRVPVLCHFAEHDGWCNTKAVGDLEADLRSGKVDHVLHRYAGTQHAFMNESRPEVYDAKAAKLAFDRSVAFLRERLA
jgi:carboxymethylenebutenolidase